ncbi:alpha/beta hydrolase [uncultured Sphingomonas sp.]|uniref:alpha/beta fold hydrolase n=1 Tax=uncultured Sphingomonas sp. TaxID=158754 RepID=UPI0026316BE2|nr:alpha/beta hydrolase [uncultured Sphingomonas sp.]
MADDQIRSLTFDGHGVAIAGDSVGSADAPPILFLHGGGQTRQSWGKALVEAARRGYHGIAIDLRGHGESGWAPDGDYLVQTFSEDVRAVVEALEKPPILVGASLGGLAALLVAAAPPPLVAGLVLVDVAARIEPEGAAEIGRFMTAAPDGFASLADAADAVAAYLPHRSRPTDPSGLLRNLRLRDDGRYHWHWDPAFLRIGADERSPAPDPRLFDDAARKLRVPTLLIRGGRSRVVSREGVRAFLELAPHTEFVDVADADHMVAGDANDSFNAAVFAFVARHVASR